MASVEHRKTAKGDTTYRIKVSCGYDDTGKQRFVRSDVIKLDKGLTKRQREKELTRLAIQFEDQVRADLSDADGHIIDNPHITFRELAEEWLDLVAASEKQKISSITRLKYCRERTYKALGSTEVKKITYRQIQTFIRSLSLDGVNQQTGRGLSAKSQQHYLWFISDVLNYARKCGLILQNPCRGIDVFHSDREKPEKDIYSLDELKTVLAAVNEQAPLNYRTYIALTAYLGLRRAEVCGLEFKDFDFCSKTVFIQRTSNYQNHATGIYTGTPKTRTSRRVLAVPDVALELVRQLQTEHEQQRRACGDQWIETDRLFIAWNGEAMHPNVPFNWLKRFCERNHLPFKGLHAFRHTFATQAITNGTDVATVSSVLGHADTSVTLNIYTHAVKEANVKAINTVADLINS